MSLGILSDLDLDLDIEKCLQNCPDIEGPLLNADALDRICLSDDLWANLDRINPLDLQLLSENGSNKQTNSQLFSCREYLHIHDDVPGITTPPQSPPDGTKCIVPTPNYLGSKTPQHVTDSVTSSSSSQVNISSVSITAQQQSQQKNTFPLPSNNNNSSVNTVIQVLKSGELVCLQVPTHTTAASQDASKSMIELPVKQESVASGQKRSNPDSGSQDPLTRKQQRMIKNRESACLSRQKKKEYVQTLEARLKEAALKNTALLQENASLRKQMTALEKENAVLRTSLARPTSPLSSIRASTVILMFVFCIALTAVPLSRFIIPFPFISSLNTNTALLPVTSHKSRALLSIESPAVETKFQNRALMTVSTGLTNYKDVGLKRQKRTIAKSKMLARHTPQTCLCSTRKNIGGDDIGVSKHSYNKTLFKKINREMLDCLKVEQTGFSSVPYQNKDDKLMNSLAVLDPALHTTLTDIVSPENDMRYSERLYEHLRKDFIRDFDNFYLISFKDHLLLDAPLYNITHPPQLSVIIPTNTGLQSAQGVMRMLQINCEILSTRIIYMNLNT